MPSAEPTLAALSNPARRYFLATRPAFLTVTLVAGLIGLATAFSSGLALNAATAGVTVLFALVAHAGINVLNDYYDALNGADELNTGRLFPFTGGSRFIQNGAATARARDPDDDWRCFCAWPLAGSGAGVRTPAHLSLQVRAVQRRRGDARAREEMTNL